MLLHTFTMPRRRRQHNNNLEKRTCCICFQRKPPKQFLPSGCCVDANTVCGQCMFRMSKVTCLPSSHDSILAIAFVCPLCRQYMSLCDDLLKQDAVKKTMIPKLGFWYARTHTVDVKCHEGVHHLLEPNTPPNIVARFTHFPCDDEGCGNRWRCCKGRVEMQFVDAVD